MAGLTDGLPVAGQAAEQRKPAKCTGRSDLMSNILLAQRVRLMKRILASLHSSSMRFLKQSACSYLTIPFEP